MNNKFSNFFFNIKLFYIKNIYLLNTLLSIILGFLIRISFFYSTSKPIPIEIDTEVVIVPIINKITPTVLDAGVEKVASTPFLDIVVGICLFSASIGLCLFFLNNPGIWNSLSHVKNISPLDNAVGDVVNNISSVDTVRVRLVKSVNHLDSVYYSKIGVKPVDRPFEIIPGFFDITKKLPLQCYSTKEFRTGEIVYQHYREVCKGSNCRAPLVGWCEPQPEEAYSNGGCFQNYKPFKFYDYLERTSNERFIEKLNLELKFRQEQGFELPYKATFSQEILDKIEIELPESSDLLKGKLNPICYSDYGDMQIAELLSFYIKYF